MTKIYGLDKWQFDKKTPVTARTASVRVHTKYIDLKEVAELTPKERVEAIDKHFKSSFSDLLKTELFGTYKLIGSKKRPTGVETTMLVKHIEQLAKFSFIESVFINSIEGGKKVAKEDSPKFFCIKMTVTVQIEGVRKGLQTYEERYVLIKAKSSDEAYKTMERHAKQYEQSYLNSKGQFVRWKVESLDDCYVTDIVDCNDLNEPEGAEVFSILKKRKLTEERRWSGKPD